MVKHYYIQLYSIYGTECTMCKLIYLKLNLVFVNLHDIFWMLSESLNILLTQNIIAIAWWKVDRWLYVEIVCCFFVIGWVCLFCIKTEPLRLWSVSEQVPFLLSSSWFFGGYLGKLSTIKELIYVTILFSAPGISQYHWGLHTLMLFPSSDFLWAPCHYRIKLGHQKMSQSPSFSKILLFWWKFI